MPSPKNFSHGPLTLLGDMPIKEFLANYWQKKPLLIRGAVPQLQTSLTPEELAGFALEDAVESRLICEQPADNPLLSGWQIKHGPLTEEDFAKLPSSHWTLLVQAVDQLDPDTAQLLNRFRFIPNWRLDDIMVSYAADQGGVGPHFDYYDVFLLQAQGSRRWRLGQKCGSSTPLRSDTEMNILSQFEGEADYLLQPGDMLYIPPNKAHWGIAEGPCMTYSIGFRAPSYSDLLLDFSAEVAAGLNPDQRYSDADELRVEHPGEISGEAVESVRRILMELTQDKQRIAHWLASYGTSNKRTAPEPDDAAHPDADEDSVHVALKTRIRAAYVPQTDTQAEIYLEGEASLCSLKLAQDLTSYSIFKLEDYQNSEDRPLLIQLLENGWLVDHD